MDVGQPHRNFVYGYLYCFHLSEHNAQSGSCIGSLVVFVPCSTSFPLSSLPYEAYTFIHIQTWNSNPLAPSPPSLFFNFTCSLSLRILLFRRHSKVGSELAIHSSLKGIGGRRFLLLFHVLCLGTQLIVHCVLMTNGNQSVTSATPDNES